MQPGHNAIPPFVRSRDTTRRVMADVIIALIPCLLAASLAYGLAPLLVALVSVGSALLAEWLFSLVWFGRRDTVLDGSAVITGMLMAFTIGAFTPLYVVAFGAAAAVIFGKLLWGGLGRNLFNPALVGREFMTVFFPLIMSSAAIWHNGAAGPDIAATTGSGFLDRLLFHPAGAIGEYSPLLLVLGGLWLLLRRRISWHIPFAMCAAFTLVFLTVPGNFRFSPGGMLLGAIFMATDMPTGASTRFGKLWYGAMIGIVAVICLTCGAETAYLSYSILLVNAFSPLANRVFRPRVWGTPLNMARRTGEALALTAAVFAACAALVWLHREKAVAYLVFVYIVFCIARFVLETRRAVS